MFLRPYNQFRVVFVFEPFCPSLHVSSNPWDDICANDVGMTIEIVFAQGLNCYLQLLNCMPNICSLQFHIPFLQRIARNQKMIASHSVRYGASIHSHSDVGQEGTVNEENPPLVFLKPDYPISRRAKASAIDLFHTPSRKLKSSEISSEAPSRASAEINLKSSSMMDTARPSHKLYAATSSKRSVRFLGKSS